MPKRKRASPTTTDTEILNLLQAMAQAEGCNLQTLIDEAFKEYVERRQKQKTETKFWPPWMKAFPNMMICIKYWLNN